MMSTVAQQPKPLTFDEVAAIAESVGLPGVTFAQLARGESSLNPGAIGKDPGGTRGLGLWQITTGYNDDIIKKYGGAQNLLNDPLANARAAKDIYDRQGIGAWYGTKYLTSKNLHYKGGASAPNPAGSPSPAAGGSPSAAPLIGSPGQAGDVTGLLSSLLAKPEQQAPAPMALQAPSFAAKPELPGGFSPLAQTAAPQAPQETGVSQALGLLETLRGADPQSGASGGSEAADGPQMPPIAESVAAGQQPIAESVYRQRANQIDAAKLPYLWGGGHGGKVNVDKNLTPLDCSGAVSAVLGIDPRVSGQFTSWGKAGDGGSKGVTVYANDEHVLMSIDGHFWGTSQTNPGGGAGWIPRSAISREYLKGFTARHL
jgi:hypothetical protein